MAGIITYGDYTVLPWPHDSKIPNPGRAVTCSPPVAYNACPLTRVQSLAVSLPVRLITADSELEHLCQCWHGREAVGLDTEFVRESTYHPIPALVQVADEDGCWLLDPLSLTAWQPFFQLLADPRVVKVMHAPGQDLELFRLMGSEKPRSLYDTQSAAILAGLGQGPGYQALVSMLLDEDLPKTETRSDWRKRPLSEAQQHYAAQDVAYLLELKSMLDGRLASLDRAAWQAEENERMVVQAWRTDDAAGLKRLKQAWRLAPDSQMLLKELWLWRERRARELDRPRQRVLKDGPMQRIAAEFPDSQNALARLDLPPGWIRRFADDVLPLGQAIRELPESEHTPEFTPPASQGEARPRFKKLRNTVTQVAEKLELPASFLVNRQTLESLATDPPRDGRLPDSLQGWRAEVLGPALLSALEDAPETQPEG